MKLKNILSVVKDIERARQFYHRKRKGHIIQTTGTKSFKANIQII